MAPELSALADRLRAAAAHRPGFVVGIDGRSGVGKSTASAALAAACGGVVVDGDSFYAGGTALRTEPPDVLAELCLDRPKLAAVLAQLRRGAGAGYRPFDWEAFDGRLCARETRIAPAPLYILDGVYSCHPALGDLVDLRVLGRVPDATRRARLLAREGAIGPWERQWHAAEHWYLTTVMPPDRFDLVVELAAAPAA